MPSRKSAKSAKSLWRIVRTWSAFALLGANASLPTTISTGARRLDPGAQKNAKIWFEKVHPRVLSFPKCRIQNVETRGVTMATHGGRDESRPGTHECVRHGCGSTVILGEL